MNFSDPLGLCKDPTDTACQWFEAGMTALGTTVGFIGGGGGATLLAAATGGAGAVAVPAGASEGAALGGAAGLALAKTLSPFLFSENSGFGFTNRRFNVKGGVNGRGASVDVERGGSGEYNVHLQMKGRPKIPLESQDTELPRSMQNNTNLQNTIRKAFDWLARIQGNE